ncbi:DEAD/DEAH box helicase [Chromobacterium phragmitis]|uniref:DEAD/DEAH box helicase n=2 Tax=Chromobacterium amazonense TaxID=1382803 RepID=UPI0021B792F5|nr:DEAD/DEAH box helicase [Chromobacterium amazonense]MBM2885950.1 DEAD/DEAH box helicase [Chromobacterium amazonense]
MNASSLRLIWRLRLADSGIQLLPLLQSAGPDGWNRGRACSLPSLLRDEHASVAEHDVPLLRQLLALLRQYDGDAALIDATPLLPALIGHPLLFDAAAPARRIRVEAGQAALQMERVGAELRLKLLPDRLASCGGVLWQRPQPERLLVYQLSDELKALADLVGHGLTVPWQARQRVLEAIREVAPGLQLVDASPQFDPEQASEPADPTLYALLTRQPEGLRLQLKVKPHPAAAWSAPGRGAAGLVLDIDGAYRQFARDLAEEARRLRALREACPAIARGQRDGDGWLFADQHSALSLLSQLQAAGEDRVVCLWPQGDKIRLAAAAGMPLLKLKVKRRGGWLQADGELELDDGRVLALRHLLAALANQKGKYLQLSDGDWLALSGSLGERLGELARMVDHAGPDGLAISPLAGPRLQALGEEAGQFDGDEGWQRQAARWREAAVFDPQVPATLNATLRPYQLQGFAWMARLAHWGVGACLADDMGLGKTVQTLSLLLTRAHLGPQLAVAPTSVALNWLAEAARFAPSLRLRAYHQHRRLDDVGPGDLVVVSYGLLQREADAFGEVHWASVVLDEAQAIKNPQSQRAQVAQSLRADFRLAASGTPVENHLGELWSLFCFIAPGLLGNLAQFEQRYAQPIADGDDTARAQLKALIQPYLLRRTKREVLTELPPKTETTRLIELSEQERHVYEAMRQEALARVAEADPAAGGQTMQALAELTRLRRFCCHPKLVQPDSALPASKLAAFAEICEELLDNGHKALVFSQFVDHLALAAEHLTQQGIRFHYLDGSTPAKQRKASMDAFQAGDGDLFLISLKAGGTGLNLTAADYVIHLDPWWNPAVEDQASDRAYRMGQQRPVTVYRLVAAGTIEEKIVELHREKRALADSLLADGDASARLDGAALLALLRGDSV